MVRIIVILLASVISGILYRMGGATGYNTKFRDLGCPTVATALLLTNWHPINILSWLMVVLSFVLMFAALTTYWDFLFKYDNFWAHGFMIGLASFPLYWAGVHWWGIVARTVLCCIGIGLTSKLMKWDVGEEWGRGFWLTALMPILLI